MSAITGLGSYASQYLQELNTALTENRQSSGSSLVNSLSGQMQNTSSSSLADQLSGLVRLTRYAMDEMGLAEDSRVTFSRLQEYCDQVQERFSQSVKDGLGALHVDPNNVTYTLDGQGNLTCHSADKTVEALAQLACDDMHKDLQKLASQLKASGLSLDSGISFSLDGQGNVTGLGESANYQDILASQKQSFANLSSHLATAHVDTNIDFSLKVNADDSVSVNCADSKYTKVLQAFFNENSEIVSDYQRSEALSQIEQARKFMSLSPKDARTRLQLESMAAWWDTQQTSSSPSSFGLYNNGSFSRLSGLNLSV